GPRPTGAAEPHPRCLVHFGSARAGSLHRRGCDKKPQAARSGCGIRRPGPSWLGPGLTGGVLTIEPRFQSDAIIVGARAPQPGRGSLGGSHPCRARRGLLPKRVLARALLGALAALVAGCGSDAARVLDFDPRVMERPRPLEPGGTAGAGERPAP